VSTRRIHFNRHVQPRRQPQQPRPEPIGSPDICPRCGGALRPTTGIQRFLDPRLVCATCGYLWTADEAAARSWRRGDRDPEPPGAGGYLLLLILHWAGGFLLLFILSLMWYVAEREGWCRSIGEYDWAVKCISGESTREALRVFRVGVPSLTLVWLAVGTVLVNKREGGCITVLASGLLMLVAFCLILYMS
jgi:hypothetical protein